MPAILATLFGTDFTEQTSLGRFAIISLAPPTVNKKHANFHGKMALTAPKIKIPRGDRGQKPSGGKKDGFN